MYGIDSSTLWLQVNSWSREELTKFLEYVFEGLNIEMDDMKENCRKMIDSKTIDSPLLLVMYMSILVNDETGHFDNENVIRQKYQFYTQFMLHLPRRIGGNEYIHINEQILDDVSGQAFSAYLQGSKKVTVKENMECIYKSKGPDNKAEFAHETFFEYFVARYYLLQLDKYRDMGQLLSVLGGNYSNSYADFISSGLKSLNEQEQIAIMRKYIYIYYCVIDEQAAKKLANDLKDEDNWIWQWDRANRNKWQNYIRGNKSKITGKVINAVQYEIVFRLGRLKEEVKKNQRIDFLEKIYDILADKLKEEKDYNEKRNIVIIMRCCAISSSFLSGEKIEMDYVKRMVDDPPNNLFDEVNRAHTLIFYGDVKERNIYEFKDDEATSGWVNARKKRIDRLRITLDENLENMDASMRRKVYFRLFDVATIYTFLRSRPRTELTDDEKEVLMAINICPGNKDGERSELIGRIVKDINKKIS